MKFLADIGLSQSSVNWLRQNGYDIIHLREEGLQRTTERKSRGQVLIFENLKTIVRKEPDFHSWILKF